jgi:hypothetical protein
MVIGSILTTDDKFNPISLFPTQLGKLAYIMTEAAAQWVPEQKLDDQAIDIKDRVMPLWGLG